MLRLHIDTSSAWLEAVLADFDAFLLDHAACERKASASAMSFVVRYPDRQAILAPLIDHAIEELQHFQLIYTEIERRGLTLARDTKDPYIQPLIKAVRTGRDERLLDRLLLFGVVEARGCERFGMVAEALPEGPLKDLYLDLTRSEARHHALFVRLARHYFDDDTLQTRLDQLLTLEAEVVRALPIRAALH